MRKEKTSVPKLTFPVNIHQHYHRIDVSKKIPSVHHITSSGSLLVLNDGSSGILRYLHEVYGDEDVHMRALYESGKLIYEYKSILHINNKYFAHNRRGGSPS